MRELGGGKNGGALNVDNISRYEGGRREMSTFKT